MKFIAVGAPGLEELIEEEVNGFGGSDVEKGKGLVVWTGPLESGYRACLWSRYSSKVLMPIVTFDAGSEDELYANVRQQRWDEHLGVQDSLAVECSLSAEAPFHHSKYAALRVKDGVVDYFRDHFGQRPDVRTARPSVRLNVYVEGKRSTLSIDLSGESLHRRGYRRKGGEAPLKETLAAAIVKLSGWQGDMILLDPMCGSGTLLIEAALMHGDSAPGLGRSYFGLLGWRGHDPLIWDDIVSEAIEREEAGREKVWPDIIGYDGDQTAIHFARENIRAAGLDEKIQVFKKDLSRLKSPGKEGVIITNPPYGERLSEKDTVRYLYRAYGDRLTTSFTGWHVGLFTARTELADMVGFRWDKTYRLHNGQIPCRLYRGVVSKQQGYRRFVWSIDHNSEITRGVDFANRLKKNLKKTMGWAKRENVSCFRVYDRDMPEYNVCIDLYEKWVHIQEFAAPRSVGEERSAERFQTVLYVVRKVLAIGRDRIFIKQRKRQRGKSQYNKKGSDRKKMYVVREGDARFLVNFSDYLDTGLFLDHRKTRLRIGKSARGLRFLNLFGYTASATVHAALGGASLTTTVDLSATYTRWAAENMALNGIYPERHRLVRADCMEWLKTESQEYDLMFIDPPTFSNTKKKTRVFDIQKQHPELIERAARCLSKKGLIIFSTNYRSFRMDDHVKQKFECVDITEKTIPEDFRGGPRAHRCWEIRRKKELLDFV